MLALKDGRLADRARHGAPLLPQPLLNAAGVEVMQAGQRLDLLLRHEIIQADAACVLVLVHPGTCTLLHTQTHSVMKDGTPNKDLDHCRMMM